MMAQLRIEQELDTVAKDSQPSHWGKVIEGWEGIEQSRFSATPREARAWSRTKPLAATIDARVRSLALQLSQSFPEVMPVSGLLVQLAIEDAPCQLEHDVDVGIDERAKRILSGAINTDVLR